MSSPDDASKPENPELQSPTPEKPDEILADIDLGKSLEAHGISRRPGNPIARAVTKALGRIRVKHETNP